MPDNGMHVVTGAFGYSGHYIARRLLTAGVRVRTLTDSPRREHDFGDAIDIHSLAFDNRADLVASLRGCDVLYNTYWVRFNHKNFTMAGAVANTLKLFEAAKEAGVGRIVHVSITNPSEDSPQEYFRSKARLERELIETGVSHAILRPAVLFGGADILINNIAWALRKLPVFGVFGDGEYRIQPMHVDDFARTAIELGAKTEDAVVNGVGPETFTYRHLVQTIGEIIGKTRPIVSVPRPVGFAFAWLIGKLVGDVMLTREEIDSLMGDLLCADTPPTGETKLTEWAEQHAEVLGKRYACEVARRSDRRRGYESM